MEYSPKYKDLDFKIKFQEEATTVFVFLRDDITEFLNFVTAKFNPVLYYTGSDVYTKRILEKIDPNGLIKTMYGSEHCHHYYNVENEITEYIRDINLFSDISLKRKIILDENTLSNIFSPDNVLPFQKYDPDLGNSSLSNILEYLDKLKDQEDVRVSLIQDYYIRQSLISSRLL